MITNHASNELRRKGLCFICNKPRGPEQSCMSDTEEMVEVDQEEVPFGFSNDDSYFIDKSMDSYEDDSEEHEQSCGVGDNNLDIHFLLTDEYD